MSTSFSEIYAKTISLMDDPYINRTFAQSQIGFYKIMFTFIQNAIPQFINPISEVAKLSNFVAPSGRVETFVGNDTDNVLLFSSPPVDAIFEYTVNNNRVNATYDPFTNLVIFENIYHSTDDIRVEWYSTGGFVETLSLIEQEILARLTLLKWTEKEKNFLLDIRRLLNDTDFRMYSEANSLKTKIKWYESLREEIDMKMQQYAWSSTF